MPLENEGVMSEIMKNMNRIATPVSMTELGIYLDWTKDLSSTAYDIPYLFSLPSGTDLNRLADSLNEVFRAHRNLLSHFQTNADGTVSRLVPDCDSSEITVDISYDDGEPDLNRLARPFSDPEGDLYRIHIIRGLSGAYLFIQIHHLVFDGTSTMVFIRDLSRAYAGELLAAESFTAGMLAEKEAGLRKSKEFSDAEKWYDDLLSGTDSSSELYHDRECGQRKVAYESISLDMDSDKLKSVIHGLGIKTSAFFTCVYGYALSRFSGSKEALFASIHAGRSPEIADDIGMFVKTFPVLERFDGNERISDHLRKTNEQILGHRKNGLFSFADVCSKYNLSIPAMFAYQGENESEVDFLGSKAALKYVLREDPRDDFLGEVLRSKGEYVFRLSYRTDLYEKGTAENFVQCYRKIAHEFADRAEGVISDVDIASESQNRLLDAFLPANELPSGSNDIVSLFRQQARKHPDAVALVIGDIKRTYAEIDDISNRIACHLIGKGVGRGSVVSILIHRNEYMVIASLGALKSGAGYQPLDPSYPPERLLFMVQDAKASLVIADEDLVSLIAGYEGEFLLTKDISSLPPFDKSASMPVINGNDVFTLLYTSGSTGVPKGVVLEHGNLVNFCKSYQKECDMGVGTVNSAYASYGFDANMMDMYPALTCGGTICVVPEEIRLDFQALGEYLGKNSVSISFMTTQVGRQFAISPFRPSCLKHLMVGGEKLVPLAPPEGLDFKNIYGPTECTIFVTHKTVDREYLRIPIGSSFAGAALYVVDEYGRRVPPCVPGELWIAGRCVGRGYLNRPEQTAKCFTENPFSKDAGYERVYHTGDIVRYLPNGEIDFLGRNDGQVKVRGFRIELSEVEGVIREYPGIRDACVHAWDMGEGGKMIAAYVVSDDKVDVKAVGLFILERKPPYMVPASIMQLDSIPLNQNGKVNRRMLPKPSSSSVSQDSDAVSVKREDNMLETELKRAISEITGSGDVPYDVPLEYAGLTSIGVIRLSAFLYNKFGISLNSKALKGKSLLDLENDILRIWMEKGVQTPSSDNAQVKAGSLEPYPLSAAQLGIYMECMKEPESTSYNIPVVMEFVKGTDAGKLAKSIAAVIKAHASVNVHFELIDSQIMAVANGLDEIDIPIFDMSHAEKDKFKSEFAKAFHLNKGPLYSFAIIRTEESVCLIMDFHHLVFDGYSLDLFFRDLSVELSGGHCQAEGASYADFVRWQQNMLTGEHANDFDRYFAGIFEKYESPSQITPDKPKSDVAGKSGSVRKALPQSLVSEAIKRVGVSEAAFFLAAADYVVARLTNSNNVYISTISSGRSEARFSRTYGMFVNTLPLASELSQGTIDDYIKSVADGFSQAIEHENYPFARVADKWGYSVEIMYAYQRDIVQKPDIPGLMSEYADESNDLKFPIFIRIVDDSGNPAVEVEYDDSMYSEGFAEKIAKYCCIVASCFAENGEKRLRSVSLLDENEKRLLDGFHTVQEQVRVPDDVFFFSGMERNAAEHPDRLALIASDGKFTYGEFDSITDRVANALIKRGANAGGKVLILLPRTSRALFAFFGASKAGLGYIPFDPAYPAERINLVIEDSDAQFVITSSDMLSRFEGRNAVDIEELLKETDASKPHVGISQDDISYMIYTSGSTGRPKGVMLTHRGMAHYVADMPGKEMVNTLRSCCSVYCSITTLSFDISVMEYSLALSNGLTLYFANEQECNNADMLAERMMETKADVISGTPSRIQTLLASSKFCEALRKYGKLVICGGEKYPDKLMQDLKELVDHPMNIYGPSEITISCNEHDLANDDVVTIGKPTPGVIEYIVDTDGNELPIGMVGEVYIGGWGVGKGYNNLPEMTKDRFIDYNVERIYKSGDYGRWLENGYMQILGRKDNQIKLRGLRIELGEIETVLAAQPGMKHVAVKIEKINGIEHLCAWFANDNKVDIQALKMELGRTLTPYMVPTAYMQLDEIPFTPNGKLDLKNLPLPSVFRGGGETAQTKAEKDFCEIFSSLLAVDDVLVTESFFDLGGTSLLVTKVVIEANKRGYGIVFGDVFANPTPRKLASMFEKGEESNVDKADSEIEDYDYSEINSLLERNTLDAYLSGEPIALGNVFLSGATGYLGIHVLHELIKSTDCVIYCLVRGGKRSPETRLKELLMYYFESPCKELFGTRIIPVEGDITDKAKLEACKSLPIDTVINCAASVKHFAADSRIEDINVGGVVNLIDFCLSKNARMIQTSTMSVIEIGFEDMPETCRPNEHSLYFGQDLSNKYVHSKFLAERAVLEAIVKKGLKAKIMRYGNLSARHEDGEFQINFESNSAMGRLRAFTTLGCAPFGLLDETMEFSPIDMVAKATVMLSRTPDDCILFHVITDQYVQMVHVFNEMKALGYDVSFMEKESFDRVFADTQSDPKKAPLLTSLMAYASNANERERKMLPMDRHYTLQVLYRMGFVWPITSWDYFRKFVGALSGLGYFDNDF